MKNVNALLVEAGLQEASSATLIEVSDWVNGLFEVIHTHQSKRAQMVYDLVALYMLVWRTKPQLLSEVTGFPVPEKLSFKEHFLTKLLNGGWGYGDEQEVKRHIRKLVRAAIEVPKPVLWVKELSELEEAVVENGEEQPVWARDLLADLDGAFRVAAAAKIFLGEVPAKLARELHFAKRALYRKADVFLVIPEYVGIIARSVETENPVHPALPESAEWCEIVLDEIARYRRFERGE